MKVRQRLQDENNLKEIGMMIWNEVMLGALSSADVYILRRIDNWIGQIKQKGTHLLGMRLVEFRLVAVQFNSQLLNPVQARDRQTTALQWICSMSWCR